MAFRLKAGESVRGGVRRLAAKELGRARQRLRGANRPSDEAVHEARKSVKKARAIMQLIDNDRGRHLERSRKRLRSINRRLSPVRDADAMLEILDKLRARAPRLISEHTFARVWRRLASEKRAAMQRADRARAWKAVDRDL